MAKLAEIRDSSGKLPVYAEMIEELKFARCFLEHSYARLGMFAIDLNDRDAQAIIRWAIFDIDRELYKLLKS